MCANWWLLWVLDWGRFDLASPPHPPVLDFHALLSVTPRYPVLSHCPQALLIPPQQVSGRPILPQSCVLHSYSCLTTGLHARRIHYWLYPLKVTHLSCQLLQFDCIFRGEGGSHSVLVYFWRAYFCIRHIITFRVVWWDFW